MSIPMNLFCKPRFPALFGLPLLLALGGCGEQGPDCASAEARDAVVKTIADDRNNRLLKYATDNSDAVAALLDRARAEDEKSAILEKAKQGAAYALDQTIVVNSTSARIASCTGLLAVTLGDTTVQKEVEFKVEQATDGKLSVSVRPFQF